MSCSRCQQVVEIATLQEHLLDECERRADFAACPTCGDALEAGAKFEAHVAAQSCKPQPAAGSGKQRCVSAQGAPQVRLLAHARARARVATRAHRVPLSPPALNPPRRAQPLCHADIEAEKEGWLAHLLEHGCVNNPRNDGWRVKRGGVKKKAPAAKGAAAAKGAKR